MCVCVCARARACVRACACLPARPPACLFRCQLPSRSQLPSRFAPPCPRCACKCCAEGGELTRLLRSRGTGASPTVGPGRVDGLVRPLEFRTCCAEGGERRPTVGPGLAPFALSLARPLGSLARSPLWPSRERRGRVDPPPSPASHGSVANRRPSTRPLRSLASEGGEFTRRRREREGGELRDLCGRSSSAHDAPRGASVADCWPSTRPLR